MRALNILLILSLFFMACQPEKKDTQTMKTYPNDPHSFALPNEAVTSHLNLDVKVDFKQEEISGIARYEIQKSPEADKIRLDVDGLEIEKVWVDGKETLYTLGKEKEFMGKGLEIPLEEESKEIAIQYRSAPDAKALFWAEPSQTAGGKYPFLFTQSQAILARTWIPCQDSPGIRFTYEANVQVPKGMMAVMSAKNPTEKSANGVYRFEMKQAIPAYLMALAVGDIEFESVGPRTGVYAEPGLLKEAAYEFGEMEEMLKAAEELYGRYSWDRYDLIVLPPSFPFGGMENPRLTFCTPTIIAGDRSLTALVAHELAHSWSGNLVTNATWDDFWLNEGFTVYFERRIMEAVYGKEYAEMLEALGYQDLLNTIEELGASSNDTKLELDLEGRNPDDGMTDIAYEKGYFLLRAMEEAVGRKKFDDFLRTYFANHAFQTMTTDAFVEYANKHLFEGDLKLAQDVNMRKWIYKPGIPSNIPVPSPKRFNQVKADFQAWLDGKPAGDLKTKNYTTHEWLHFIHLIPEGISKAKLEELDEAFGFTKSGNSEILCAWFKHTIPANYAPADSATKAFLIKVGRRKFLTPLYKAMVESERKEWALEIYQKARPGYHAVSRQTIDEVLAWGEAEESL